MSKKNEYPLKSSGDFAGATKQVNASKNSALLPFFAPTAPTENKMSFWKWNQPYLLDMFHIKPGGQFTR